MPGTDHQGIRPGARVRSSSSIRSTSSCMNRLEGPVHLRDHHAAHGLHRQYRLCVDQRRRRNCWCSAGRIAIGDIQAFIQYAASSRSRSRRRRISPTSSNRRSLRRSGYLNCWMKKRSTPGRCCRQDRLRSLDKNAVQGAVVRSSNVRVRLQAGRRADGGSEHRRAAGSDRRRSSDRPERAKRRSSTC